MTPTLTDFGDNELEFIVGDRVYDLYSHSNIRRASIEDFFHVLLPDGPANFPVSADKEEAGRIAMAVLKSPDECKPIVRDSDHAIRTAKRLRITTTPSAIQKLNNNFPSESAVLHGPNMDPRNYIGDLKELDMISHIRNVPSAIAKDYLPENLFKANKPHQDIEVGSLIELKEIASRLPANSKVELTAYRGRVNLLNDENVKALSGLVLDCDDPGAIEDAKSLFGDQHYILVSSHSYCEAKPYKARMFLPFAKPIDAENIKPYTLTLSNMNFDGAVNSLSHKYSMPVAQPESTRGKIRPIAEVNYGPLLNEEVLERVVGRTLINESKSKNKSQKFMGADGKLYSKSSLFGELKFDYESMKKRHRFAMENLQQKQERDSFAYQVIKREVSLAESNLSLRNTILFIHAACADPSYSNKSLCHPSSDTAASLPEKFRRQINRNTAFPGMTSSQLNQEIKRHIREAQALSKKGGLALLSSAMEVGSPAPKPQRATKDPEP